MSAVESIKSGVLPVEFVEALRTFLSRNPKPYLDIPGADGPGVCISTSFADFCRYIESKHLELGGGRRKLPNSPLVSRLTESIPHYRNAATQTNPRPESPTYMSTQPESLPGTRKRKRLRRPFPSRAICSSSGDPEPGDRVATGRSPRRSLPHSRSQESLPPAPPSSPCAWEKAVNKPVGPVYGLEDMIGRWVPKRKRKADRRLQLPAKKPALGTGSRPNPSHEVSDADDEDDENQQSADAEQERDETAADDVATSSTDPCIETGTPTPTIADPIANSVVSSVEGVQGDNLEAALHQIEVAASVQVSSKHRSAMISQSLALGGRDALENFRQACSCWRREHAQGSQGLALPASATERHLALDRFSRAYHTAVDTTRRRAVLDILHRINLAYLYEVYIETLRALSCFSLQQTNSGPHASCRTRDIFDEGVRSTAQDRMFWACHPAHAGKPRQGKDKTFKATLANAEKWHLLREEFGVGMLALVPQGANNWFEKLPFTNLPVYFSLVRAVNPAAVAMGEMISDRVLSSWRGEEPPEQLLPLEHLETIDENPFKANPVKLLEEVNMGCITDSTRGTDKMQTKRAVTVPGDVDENDAAALTQFQDAAFSSQAVLPQDKEEDYILSSSIYSDVDLEGL